MDKNTTIGLVLIVGVLVLFSVLNKPSKEEIEAAKRRRDSIEMVKYQMQQEAQKQEQETSENIEPTLSEQETEASKIDELKNLYGDFHLAATGEEELITLENNLMRVKLSTKGGKIYSVELKNYKRHDSTALFQAFKFLHFIFSTFHVYLKGIPPTSILNFTIFST